MRKVLSLITVFALLWCHLPAFGDEVEYFIICDPKTSVCVHLAPKKSSEETGRLEFGDRVYADGKKKNGFMHCIGINNEWGEGWVHKGYLVEDKPIVCGKMATVVSNGKVFCRSCVNGTKHGSLKNGTEVKVLAYSDEWAVTKKGYIKTEYLEIWE